MCEAETLSELLSFSPVTPDTVCFVCTGNTCRSPMAEYLFNSRYRFTGKVAISAGLQGGGSPMSANAREALLQYGVTGDFDSHKSKSVSENIMKLSSQIVAMSAQHAMYLYNAFPQYASKICVMPEDIPDPYGGAVDEYLSCLRKIDNGLSILFGIDYEIVPLKESLLSEAVSFALSHFSEGWSESGVVESYNSPSANHYVCIKYNSHTPNIIAYGIISVASDEADVVNIAVDPFFRRRGVGRSLLVCMLKDAVQKGAKDIYLEVRQSNEAAIKLYNSLGFEVCGKRKNFYKSPSEDALLLKIKSDDINY